jgi:hypothetical protein
MQLGKTYSFGNGLFFKLHSIKTDSFGKKRLMVSWYRTDNKTGKRVDMDIMQEMVVSNEETLKYKVVE